MTIWLKLNNPREELPLLVQVNEMSPLEAHIRLIRANIISAGDKVIGEMIDEGEAQRLIQLNLCRFKRLR